jgi:hypothetical protein
MDRRTRLLVLVVAGSTLVLAGCLGGGDDLRAAPANATAENVTADALAAMEGVDTARIDLTVTVEGNEGTLLEADSETVVDRRNRRMRVEATAEPLLQEPIEFSQYTINETTYTRTDGEWRRETVAGAWDQDPISAYETMLDGGETELRGVTTFEGRGVYVIETTVDGETLGGLVSQQTPEAGIDASIFDDLTVEQYVDRETGHIRYLELEFETSGFGSGRTTVTLTTTLSGFDEPVDIEVPAAATGSK